jgi:polyhydroxyalkanoate synthesis regulator phasin
MLNLVKKVMLTGVGLAVMTKEKAEELGRELVKKGEITENEGKEFVKELSKKSEEARKDFENKVEENVKKILAKLDVVKKKDIDKLVKRVAALEKGRAADSEKQE